MKIRELLKRFDLWLRPAQVHGGEHGEVTRTVDNVDGLALDALANATGQTGDPNLTVLAAPPNWVPSQQDERPQ